MKKILTLVIDGLGLAEKEEGNAVVKANMPNYNTLLATYPHVFLNAAGKSVGMVEGQPGNPEVGYKTIASGKVLKQRSSFMKDFVDKDSLATNANLKIAIEQAKKKKSTVHIMGMMSDAGISSNLDDTIKIIKFIQKHDVNMVIDFIADGKDVEEKSALDYINKLEQTGVPIATICGRYYAMDADGMWDRTKIYYDLVRNGTGLKIKEIPLALKNCYMRDITDEFLPPIIVLENKQLQNNDVIIWTNFDDESSKQILVALSNPSETKEFAPVNIENLKLLMMCQAVEKINGTVLIEDDTDSSNSLGKYFGKLDISQARIALEDSFDYVTYYFNGEEDIKIPKCANYLVEVPKIETDRPRELALAAFSKQVIKCMEKDTDFILASIGTADQVAHTGDFEGTVRILEFIDECLGRIIESAEINFYTIVLTSTHGNVEEMMREESKAFTLNTTNRVPFIMCDERVSLLEGSLTDVAPTILKYMDISIPESMTGKVLIKE